MTSIQRLVETQQQTSSGTRGVGGLTARIRLVRQRMTAPWKTLAVLALAVVMFLAGWPFIRAHLQAIAVLRLASGQPLPWALRSAVTEPIQAEEVQFPVEGSMIRARLYVPVRHPDAPALVLLHGVHHLGIDEPRLAGFAQAIASCGLRVLTPELPGISDYHIDRSSVGVIGESAKWFAAKTGSPVGVVGLSFSGGLALVAAADPAYRSAYKFVLAVGSHDAMDHVATYYLTGRAVRPDGSAELLPAHEYGPLVLEYEHLEDFVSARDAAAIRPVLREHLYEDKSAEDLAQARLTVQQRTEAVALMDARSEATRAKLAAAQAKHLEEMEAVSPHGTLGAMTTPVYLLHGQADNIIPSAETLWMASELPEGTLQAVLVSPVLSHLDLDAAQPGLLDQLRMMHFFALVMNAAQKK